MISLVHLSFSLITLACGLYRCAILQKASIVIIVVVTDTFVLLHVIYAHMTQALMLFCLLYSLRRVSLYIVGFSRTLEKLELEIVV